MFAQERHVLVNEVAILTGMEVTDVLTDFALSTGEQVIVFLLASHHES
ncbi:MAG: Na-translocating system protein MpsC family protein [Nitrospiraceae bacterium]